MRIGPVEQLEQSSYVDCSDVFDLSRANWTGSTQTNRSGNCICVQFVGTTLAVLQNVNAHVCRLDGKHVVFGSVVEGMDVLKKMESVGSQSGSTSAKVVIRDSGQM